MNPNVVCFFQVADVALPKCQEILGKAETPLKNTTESLIIHQSLYISDNNTKIVKMFKLHRFSSNFCYCGFLNILFFTCF